MRDIAAGREVFNTYGEHGNRTLLMDYGFTLAPNPLDAAPLPGRCLRDAAAGALGRRAVRARVRELAAAGCWDPLLERFGGDDGFVFDLSAEPPPELLLLLTLVCAAEPPPPWMLARRGDGSVEADVDGAVATDFAKTVEMKIFLKTAKARDEGSIGPGEAWI